MQTLSNRNEQGRRKTVGLLGLGIMVAWTGCSRDSVTSYDVPKEDHTVRVANSSRPEPGPMAQRAARQPVATVKWAALPKGWEESKEQSEMTVAKFRIAAENGLFAEVSITPLPGMARAPFAEGEILKMWAEQLQLAAPPSGLKPTPIEVGGLQGKLYDLTSTEPTFEGKAKTRLTTASAPRDGALWFVKMAGAEPVVAAQQDNFREFLKGLTFQDPVSAQPSAEPEVASAPPAGGGHPQWKAPAGWTEIAGGDMVMAAYTAKTASGAKAKITVVPLAGGGGDVAANVNRWRGQVGLGPASDDEMKKDVKSVDLADGSKATVVHAKGPSQTLHGLIVPRGAQTWYYKILGDDEAVNAEAPRLPEFAASAK
jgi:hypothetical protein